MLPHTVFSKSVSSWLLAALCFLCYVFGRKYQSYVYRHPQVATSTRGGRAAHAAPAKLLPVNTPEGQFTLPHYHLPNITTIPGPAEYDALLEHSGLLKLHPPFTPGLSGSSSYILQPFQILSWHPRAVLFPNFIEGAQADHIVELATRRIQRSGLALRPGESAAGTDNIRTSFGTFLAASDDPQGVLRWLEERIAAVTGLPVENGEAFNVLRYESGQKYDSHYDSFNPSEYGPQASQRVATVLVYLSTPEEGGETIFKMEGKGAQPVADYKSCDRGLKYRPRKGDALLFWSVQPDGQLDRHSLHGGCPVVKGVKWDATKWIHNKPFRQ